MMSETSPTFGVADADRLERASRAGRSRCAHMRQHQILLVADPDFAERIALGEIGDRVHLVGGGIARAARRSASATA